MNTAVAIGALVVGALVLVGVVLMASAWRGDTRRGSGVLSRETVRRDRGEAPLAEAAAPVTGREVEVAARSATLVQVAPAPPSVYVPPEPEQVSFSRRQFFNRSAVALMSLGLAGFGAAVVAFLWPKLSGGFGSKISVGNVDAVKEQIRANKGFLYLPEGRAWITEYPVASVPKAEGVYPPAVLTGMQAGLVALYQKCPHLGCRVPDCPSSQWFECPCHGSQYNQAGEKKAGPAPRGMDLFATSVAGGNFVVDTGTIFQGAPIGTNTTGQEAEGPHCITGGGGH